MKGRLLFYVVFIWQSLSAGAMNQKSLKDSIIVGIHFEKVMDWRQAVVKATTENKYIFVDCYTTWCGPCKQMDKDVYPLGNVGQFYNDRFICIKMQMDSSENDDEVTRAMYADAHRIMEQYKIAGFPSYLFFTPDGRIINRSLGVKSPVEFIALGNEATDSAKNYYTILGRFNGSKANEMETAWLARQAALLGYLDESERIAKTYISSLNKDSLFTESNIAFMAEFTKSLNDWRTKFFFQHAGKIDSVMKNDDYTEHFLQDLIGKGVADPVMDKAKRAGKTPDWDLIQSEIRKKYGAYYAKRIVIAERCSWAGNHNDNQEYAKYLTLYVNNYMSKTDMGFWPAFTLNKYAWTIFKYSNDPDELESAQSWSGRSVLLWPLANSMDTYANILYKLKRKEEAIMWEENAAKLSPDDKGILSTLQKMKSGQSTWDTGKTPN